MNHSDDDIFCRNIDQLDRETPRFNLSEEDEEENCSVVEKTPAPPAQMKKMSTSSSKPPSVASVPPYSHPSSQSINPVMSPHLVKKQISAGSPSTVTTTSDMNRIQQQQPVPTSYYNQHYHPPSNAAKNYTGGSISVGSSSQKLPPSGGGGYHPANPPPSQPPPPQQRGGLHPNHQHVSQHHPSSYMTTQLQQSVVTSHAMGGDQTGGMCYCADCSHSQQQQQERHQLGDEIMIQKRELDSCWQEVEEDFPMDFTAHDRRKEHLYAERNDTGQSTDMSLLRESKSVGNHTSAYPTTSSVTRDHPVSAPTSSSSNALPPPSNNYQSGPSPPPPVVPVAVKTKQQAVVSPFSSSRDMTSSASSQQQHPKKVNINNVVREFSYSEEPDNPQDYASAVWPQSEMGSRIPSHERINLSPLCMSAVPSGIQTPVEPGTGQKPLTAADIPSSPAQANNNNNAPSGIPSATPLQQLPGHDTTKSPASTTGASNRAKNILEKFKGNEQYKPAVAVPPSQDSIKDFTSGRWVQSEMGSRIPSSEMISLSPLTMSGIPSGIQTPAEPNTGCIPLSEASVITQEITGAINDLGIDTESRPNSSPGDHFVNQNGVKMRQKTNNSDEKSNHGDDQINEYMGRMNLSGPDVPRFDYMEQDSVKNYCSLELSSTRQSYENLNFNGQWSNNTSGLVTPCDHGSVYGGVKPLRQQQEEKHVNFYDDNDARDGDNKGRGFVEENHQVVVSDEQKPAEHQHNSDGSGPVFSTTIDHQNNATNSTTPTNTNKPLRRISNSSIESAHSNRTDISTVVNAPMSMHNTAPASPDPDGSEISDSTISDNDEATEGAAGYAPKPGEIGAQSRWHHSTEQASRMQQQQGAGDPSQGPLIQQQGQNDPLSRKNFIQMVKEQFPKQQQQQQQPHSGNEPMHHHMAPMQQLPPQQGRYPYAHHQQQHGASPRYHQPMHPQDYPPRHHYDHPSFGGGGGPPLNNNGYERMGMQPSPPHQQRYGYPPPSNRHQHPPQQPQQHRFRAPPPHGTRYPLQSPNSHEKPEFPLHGINHMKSRINAGPVGGGGGGPITGAPHPSALGVRHHGPPINIHNNHPQQPPPSSYMHHQQTRQPYMMPPGGGGLPPRPQLPSSMVGGVPVHDFFHGEPPQQPMQTIKPPSAPGSGVGIGPNLPQQQQLPSNQPQQMVQPPVTTSHHQHATLQQPLPPTSTAIGDQTSVAPNNDPNNPAKNNRTYSVTSLEPNRASPPQNDSLDTASVVSFASMPTSHQNLDTRVDMMSSLLSMLGTHDPDDMARTFLAMSNNPDSCVAMRQSQCVPLLIDLLHNENKETGEINWGARQRAGRALHNIVHSSGNGDRRSKRETRVLHFLEVIRKHTEDVMQEERDSFQSGLPMQQVRPDHGPGSAVANIMKLSFDEEHKLTICELGGLQTVCELLAVDYRVNQDTTEPSIISLRKYVGMVLINLTYNDATNKAVLCNTHKTLQAVIGQLRLTSEEDLVQVFAGITRNISWRPDKKTQHALQSINAVRALMSCIQSLRSEVCIRAVLSAVWNLSAHNSQNKEEICRTPGSLKYLTYALSYRSPTNSLAVIENAGGILRNISSHIAVEQEYRRILRHEGCLQTLVQHLRFPSTRVVSNACGVLWNISARCVEDQDILWDLGAVSVLKTLINSKHKPIAASSTAALRNLLAVKPGSSGTDTESQMSFKHRSNSLPMRGQYRRGGDKRYRAMAVDGVQPQRQEQQQQQQRLQPQLHNNQMNNHHHQQHHSQDEGITTDRSRQLHDMYDDYPPSYRQPPPHAPNDIASPILEEGGLVNGEPPSYGNIFPPSHHQYHHHQQQQQHSKQQQVRDGVEPIMRSTSVEKTPSQYFFPDSSLGSGGRLPMSAPINRRQMIASRERRESSSSCSSFSTSERDVKGSSLPPRKVHEKKFSAPSPGGGLKVVDMARFDDKPPTSQKITLAENNGDERASPASTIASNVNNIEILNLYDDCRLSGVKDTVMIYQGTPKLPVKASIATKDGKQKLLKLTSKIKGRQKKSPDSVSSRDSLTEKSSDVVAGSSLVSAGLATSSADTSSKKKDKDSSSMVGSATAASATPKESLRTKTRNLKHRLLNKSHSSDLGFDKNAIHNKTKNKRAHLFDIYSMSNFPDRVASDQCLSMTDRYLREMDSQHRQQHLPTDMYHGSWSSCDVTRDEPAEYSDGYPPHHPPPPNIFPPSPQLGNHRGQRTNNGGGSVHSHSFLQDTTGGNGSVYSHKSTFSNSSHHHNTQHESSVDRLAKLTGGGNQQQHHPNNDSAVESDRSKSASKPKKLSILKNPLKKKNKKKSEDH